MTSKEIIKNEINNLEDILENAKKKNLQTIIKQCEEDLKQYNQVLKDLEQKELLEIELKLVNHQVEYLMNKAKELEEIKKILGTPIQDIMKRLKVLDIIQNYAIKYDNCVCIDALFYDEEVMEWCE